MCPYDITYICSCIFSGLMTFIIAWAIIKMEQKITLNTIAYRLVPILINMKKSGQPCSGFDLKHKCLELPSENQISKTQLLCLIFLKNCKGR